ncbi:MAG TPA: hypothetical protein VJR48_07245, partial [Ktedonobacterales bacterium]|nr:hypothetical protein [Ktedonobacterales bacterium]
IAFLLRARDDHFALEQQALSTRLAEMTELTATERLRLREPATASDAHYRRYMARTRGIYLALLALGGLFAIVFSIIALVHLTHR